jgi:hypothetical protein
MRVLTLILFLCFSCLISARRHESTAIRSDLEELERDVSKLIFLQKEELKESMTSTGPMNFTDTIFFYRMNGSITLTLAKNGNSDCSSAALRSGTVLSIAFDGSKPGIGPVEFFLDMIGKLEIQGCDIKLPKGSSAKVLIRGLTPLVAAVGNAASSWRVLKNAGKAVVNAFKNDRSSNSALETRGQYGFDDIKGAWDKGVAFAKETVKEFKEKGFKDGVKSLGHKAWEGIKNTTKAAAKAVLMKYLTNNSEAIGSFIRNVLTSVTSVKLDLEFDPAPRNRDHDSCQSLPPKGTAFFGPYTRAGFTVTLTIKDPRGRPMNTFMDMVSHLGLKDANGYFSNKMTVSDYDLRGKLPVAFTRVATKGWNPIDASAPITIELSDDFGFHGRNKLMYCTTTTMGRAWEEVTKLSTSPSKQSCPKPRAAVAAALVKETEGCSPQKPSNTTPCLPGSFIMRVINYFLPTELERLYSYKAPDAPELDKATWIERAKAITASDKVCQYCLSIYNSPKSNVKGYYLPHLAAILSNAAYVNKLNSDFTARDLNKKDVTFTFVDRADQEEPTSASVLMVSSPGILWVAFQGTESRKDACIDATLEMEDLEGVSSKQRVRVHKGFNTQWNALSKKVFEVVRMSSAPKIVVTGHSLGAGIAQIAALMIRTDLDTNSRSTEMNVFLFGSPRCGNEAFQAAWDDKFNGRAASFVNTFDLNIGVEGVRLWVERGVDIVTLVPPSGFGFHHVARNCRCSLPCPIPDAINMVTNFTLPLNCHSMNHYQNAFLAFV